MKFAMKFVMLMGVFVSVASNACVVDLNTSGNIRILPSQVLSDLQKIQASYNQKMNSAVKPVLTTQSPIQFRNEQEQYQHFQDQLQYQTSEATMKILRKNLCR